MTIRYNPTQRQLMYQTMRKILDKAERDDRLVASRDVQPDGYSRSTSDGNGRRSGHGDPTYSVVVRILGGEATGSLVEQYFGKLHLILTMMAEADSLRASLIPPEPTQASESEWCQSCLRVTLTDHKGSSHKLCNPVWREGATVCGFCRDWKKDYGSLPDLGTLKKHAEGKRIYRREMRAS